jgi:hypothetical protein
MSHAGDTPFVPVLTVMVGSARRACLRPGRASARIDHRLIPPRHPQANGRIERFNDRISELCQQTRFASAAELEQTLKDHLLAYKHFIPQRAIGHQSPIDALASWYTQHPELFVMPVHNQMERDNHGNRHTLLSDQPEIQV